MELKEREEIIKALECCATPKLTKCDNCSRFNEDSLCMYRLCTDAVTLIKELTEEIKDLEADYDRVYEQAEADIHGNMADGGTSCHWCMDKTKADIVKDFADYLKERSFMCDPGNGFSFDAIDVDDLDSYTKEFLEE